MNKCECKHNKMSNDWCGRNCEKSKTCKYNVTPNGPDGQQQYCFRGKEEDYCHGVCSKYRERKVYSGTKCGENAYNSSCPDCKDNDACLVYKEAPVRKCVFNVEKNGDVNVCDIHYIGKDNTVVNKKHITQYDVEQLSSKQGIVGELLNISAHDSCFVVFVKSITDL